MFVNKFYLDKEKDIVISIFKDKENIDEITYILETPNHGTGNLITNLAKIFKVETIKNEKDMKIIKGKIYARIDGNNRTVYILNLGGIKIANIYENGEITIKAKIPAIVKTLMSQTKKYNLPIEKSIVESSILKTSKFRTDLHTHMNANLTPDILIALGIKYQIKYPNYYIKKLGLKIAEQQKNQIEKDRRIVEQEYKDSKLQGKYLDRKIDDNTYINFADLILNNMENSEENLKKISKSLAILKDGQAVFTNLEKLYIYRYVFCKGKTSDIKIELEKNKIEKIPDLEVRDYLTKMLEDKENMILKDIVLRQDKFLWIAREYQKQGIEYVEITDTDLAKINGEGIKLVKELHGIMPYIEKETGVKIRLLVGLRRIPLTIIKDKIIGGNYLRENLDSLKTVSKSPYVVGSDFIGEEINDIEDLQPAIDELVEYVAEKDENFTIRIHAGENDSLRDNVSKSIECVKKALKKGQKFPKVRLGHGLYTADLQTKEGEKLLENLRECNAILEFQITSNVRLNNLSDLKIHPLKKYLDSGIKCVQGTDGCGFYGVDTIDEQLALNNLLGLDDEDFAKMREVEKEKIEEANVYFESKMKEFNKLLEGRDIVTALTELEKQNIELGKKNNKSMRINNNLESEKVLGEKIKDLPQNKVPIVIAGGSFNKKGRKTEVTEEGKLILEKLIKQVNEEKVYFVIGHKLEGYEKAIIDISKKYNKKFEVNAIIPKRISELETNNLKTKNVDGIRISIESDEMGIYKSFNYEIFERRESIVVAFDGNSPISNLVQEAKNGKGKSQIYVNEESPILREKINILEGYVTPFNLNQDIVEEIKLNNMDLFSNNSNIYKKIEI